MQIKVWYRLFDSNGAVYKDSSADQVTVDEDANIVALRKAIKNENPQIPSNLGSSQLKVYKTKKDFENNKHIDKLSTTVEHFGKDEDNAVYVVVPDTQDKAEPIGSSFKITKSYPFIIRGMAINGVWESRYAFHC
jgi:hypothetical protein